MTIDPEELRITVQQDEVETHALDFAKTYRPGPRKTITIEGKVGLVDRFAGPIRETLKTIRTEREPAPTLFGLPVLLDASLPDHRIVVRDAEGNDLGAASSLGDQDFDGDLARSVLEATLNLARGAGQPAAWYTTEVTLAEAAALNRKAAGQ